MYQTYDDYWLAHHGVLGMHWRQRNGPPYPLGSDISTGHRLKSCAAGKPTVKKDESKVKTNRTIKASVNSGIGLKPKTRTYTMDEDIAAVNPKYNPDAKTDKEYNAYCMNCCYCTTAYEMRRRGYDVKAKPRNDDEKYQALTGWRWNPHEQMFDYKGEVRTRGFGASDDLDHHPLKKPLLTKYVYNMTRSVKTAIINMPDNARGILTLDWYYGGGHSLNFEKSGNDIFVIDPQSNEKWNIGGNNRPQDTWVDKSDYMALVGNIWVTRLDDLDVIPGKIKGACS